MRDFQSRALARLVLDTTNCLQLAYANVDNERKIDVRNTIMSLNTADVTDVECAISMLRVVGSHLRQFEKDLNAADRPLIANKVRGVRQRVEHFARS
jgi:hypothetical protein